MTSPAITDETVVSRHPNAIVGALPTETLLLRVDTGTTLRLNSTAAFLWEQLDRPLGLGELAARLAGRYSITAEQATSDARALAADLAQREFLELG